MPEEEPVPVYEVMAISIKRTEDFPIYDAFKESVWVLGQGLLLSNV